MTGCTLPEPLSLTRVVELNLTDVITELGDKLRVDDMLTIMEQLMIIADAIDLMRSALETKQVIAHAKKRCNPSL